MSKEAKKERGVSRVWDVSFMPGAGPHIRHCFVLEPGQLERV